MNKDNLLTLYICVASVVAMTYFIAWLLGKA